MSIREHTNYSDLLPSITNNNLRGLFETWQQTNAFHENADIKFPEQQQRARDMADDLVKASLGDEQTITSIENIVCHPDVKDKTSILFHLSLKMALSKIRIRSIDEPIDIAIVVPVYHENIRIRPRSEDNPGTHTNPFEVHPHGENFVIEKKREADWLFQDNPHINYRFIYVDDGCDLRSGDLVQEIIHRNNWEGSHKVIFLEQEIRAQKVRQKELMHSAISGLKSPKDSQKAGAIYAGMAHATMEGADIVITTDADLSYNLGLCGSLVLPIAKREASCTVVNRRHQLSVLQESGTENNSGKRRIKALLGSLRKNLLGDLLPPDTQPGFKAFDAKILPQVLRIGNKEYGFSFDVQLLARTAGVSNKDYVKSIPTVCIDSSDETTADNDKTYFDMLKTFVRVAVENNIKNPEIIGLILDIADDEHPERRHTWNELSRLMNMTDISLDHGYDTEVIKKIQEKFEVNGNSTSSSVVMDREDIERLKSLVKKIKTIKRG